MTGENILQAGGMIDEAAGMLSYPDELIGPAGSPKTIDAGPDTWFGRLVARHAECCGLPTRPVCKYPSSGP